MSSKTASILSYTPKKTSRPPCKNCAADKPGAARAPAVPPPPPQGKARSGGGMGRG